MPRIIDVQCHIFPRSFIKELSLHDQLRIGSPDANNRRVIFDSRTGDELTFFVEDSPYVDPEKRLKDMEDYGVDVQILSLPPPGVDRLTDPSETLKLSRLINDELASIVEKNDGRFEALATIPMNDSATAADEIRRSVQELGMKGVIVSSNTNGKFYDTNDYDEVYRMLERYDVPMLVHPTESISAKQVGQDYKLALIFGWPFDTTISVSRLVFSGTLRRFPKLKVIAAHGGGGLIPFFKGRINMLARVAAGGGREIAEPNPVEAFRKIYYDAAIFDAQALELLVKFAGPEHVVFASDYPFGQNLGRMCYESSIDEMEALDVDSTVKQKILSGNMSKIMKLS